MTEKEHLIEAWTEPLEDNAEQQLLARSLLGEAIEDDAATLPAAAKWLQHPHDHCQRRITLWVLLILAFASFLYPVLTTHEMLVGLQKYRSVASIGMSNAPKVRTSTAEETFLLYGDLSRPKVSDQRRALWERDPQNAAFFAEYATHYISETASLPLDFLQTAAEIDPDNGWYLVTAAATKSKGVCRKEKTNHPRSPVTSAQYSLLRGVDRRKMGGRIVHEYTIVDPVAMEEVLALWRKSLQYERHETYAIPLHRRRYPILSQHLSFTRYVTNILYLFDSTAYLLGERYLSDVLATALQKADMHSAEGKQLFRDITAYTERIAAQEPDTLVDVLLRRRIFQTLYKQIDVIDTSPLETAMVATWRQRRADIQQLNDDLRMQVDTQSDFLRNHGSLLTALALPTVQRVSLNPQQLSMEELKPMRYTDHCVILHFLAAACIPLLLTLVPYHVWGRNGKLPHRLSDELWLSMPGRSLVSLVVLSVVVPLLYFTALTVWTPLTGKEYGAGKGFLFPVCPAISVALILFVLPRLLAHRFTAAWQKLHPKRKPWYLRLGWAALILLLLPLHLLPWIIQVTKSDYYIKAFMDICWLPAILWLLWTLVAGLFTKDVYPAVMQSLRRRAVGACTLSSIILLSLTCWALKQCERSWLQKDTIMSISPDKPTLRHEAEIIQRAHADLRGVLHDGEK